jgi:CxxC motif-containing protein (DUF1111 family)
MIAFHSNRDGNLEIYKVPSTGGLITRLTNNPAVDANPAWAPNNSAIAFTSLRSGSARIWIMETNGSRPSQISATTGDLAAYSRDQGETTRTFRASPHILGDGFVEATDDSTFLAIQAGQPVSMRGTAISVPLLEAPGQTRLGRFGWKDSVASLLSFLAGAYLAEMGITSPLQPEESTSLGRSITAFDIVPDVEDGGGPQGFGEDVEAFARFMRSTKAPPRDRALVPDDAADPGSALFDQVSCSVCHVRNITSAPTNSGAQSFALNEAILRHAGQATSSRTAYQALTLLQKAQLIRFLKSL